MGQSLACQKKYQKAKAYLLEALDIRQEILGQEHPEVANTLNNLGALHVDLENFVEAENLYKQSLDIRRKFFDEDHMYIANSYNNLGRCYYLQHNYQDAENLYTKALKILENSFGTEHPITGMVQGKLQETREKLAQL